MSCVCVHEYAHRYTCMCIYVGTRACMCARVFKTGCALSLDWCVVKLSDCTLEVFQLTEKGWIHWKEEMIASRSIAEGFFFHRPQSFLTLTHTKQLLLEKGRFVFGEGMNFLLRWTWIKVSHWVLLSLRRNRSIYLACSLSTCFLVRQDPMESPIEWRNEKGVFLSFSPHFFLLQWCSRCHGDPRAQQGGAQAR